MPSPNDLQNQTSSVPWTNGRGLITGAVLSGLFATVIAIFATIGSWDTNGALVSLNPSVTSAPGLSLTATQVTTTNNGLIKGNGSGLTVAVSGADYQAPSVTVGSVLRSIFSFLQENVTIRDFGAACDGAMNDASALSSMAANLGHIVVPQNCTLRVATTASFSVPIEIKAGGIVKPDGVSVTFLGSLTAPVTTIFQIANGGIIKFAATQPIEYAEWWGPGAGTCAFSDWYCALNFATTSGALEMVLFSHDYPTSTTWVIATSQFYAHGNQSAILAAVGQVPRVTRSSSTGNIIQVGTATPLVPCCNYPRGIRLENFLAQRTVQPAFGSQPIGIALMFALAPRIYHMGSQDNTVEFYMGGTVSADMEDNYTVRQLAGSGTGDYWWPYYINGYAQTLNGPSLSGGNASLNMRGRHLVTYQGSNIPDPEGVVIRGAGADTFIGYLDVGGPVSTCFNYSGTPDASFTGSVAGSTLTVTSAPTNPIQFGMYLTASGLAAGSRIGALASGTGGSGSTYTLTNSGTVASQTLIGIAKAADQDIRLHDITCDSFTSTGILIQNVNAYSSIHIDGGYVETAATGALAAVHFYQANGKITMTNVQMPLWPANNAGGNVVGILAEGSSGITTKNNQINGSQRPVILSGVFGSDFEDSIMNNAQEPATEGAIIMTNSSRNRIVPNITGATNAYPAASSGCPIFCGGLISMDNTNTYNEIDASSTNPGTAVSGSKLYYNGAAVTATGVFGAGNAFVGVPN